MLSTRSTQKLFYCGALCLLLLWFLVIWSPIPPQPPNFLPPTHTILNEILHKVPPVLHLHLHRHNLSSPWVSTSNSHFLADLQTETVLLITPNPTNLKYSFLAYSLNSARIAYHVAQRPLEWNAFVKSNGKPLYLLLLFENFNLYWHLSEHERNLLDKYCHTFHVAMIGFVVHSSQSLKNPYQLGNFPLLVHGGATFEGYYTTADSRSFLRLTRPGSVALETLSRDFVAFTPLHHGQHYNTLAFTKMASEKGDESVKALVVHDVGRLDGVQRVFFGGSLKHWMHRIVFLDCLFALTGGLLKQRLERTLMVDIDDMFVGASGMRLLPHDVQALVETQASWRQNFVQDFTFNVGFSGKFFLRGNAMEQAGDWKMIGQRHHFNWFPHMWDHMAAHRLPHVDQLRQLMLLNKRFANTHELPVDGGYAVAPHHSGVYPVHMALYEAWREAWNISVTSTEEYPHFQPAHERRGFVFKGVSVLPRQTCGVYTKTIHLDAYPGGKEVLHRLIMGGALFDAFLFNPVLVFMTHMSNYGGDRLAVYVFEAMFQLLRHYTQLHLRYLPPQAAAEDYFQLYPQERGGPVWVNPCDTKKHREIWPATRTCNLPSVLLVGPQKSGSTALLTFLKSHPQVEGSRVHPVSFEEVQFFSNEANYARGLDWYLAFYKQDVDPGQMEMRAGLEHVMLDGTQRVLVDKSATYFDHPLAPFRAHMLLPAARIVVILEEPGRRAYSWYQHQRAHHDPVAMSHTFLQVLTAPQNISSPTLTALRNRCLAPGLYSRHLENWSRYFPVSNFHFVDGDLLRETPVEVMHELQTTLGLMPQIDYSQILEFVPRKGFFCVRQDQSKNKGCLGSGKGRRYPPMEPAALAYLAKLYDPEKAQLMRLLQTWRVKLPKWLSPLT